MRRGGVVALSATFPPAVAIFRGLARSEVGVAEGVPGADSGLGDGDVGGGGRGGVECGPGSSSTAATVGRENGEFGRALPHAFQSGCQPRCGCSACGPRPDRRGGSLVQAGF